jgi:hypothetical protein
MQTENSWRLIKKSILEKKLDYSSFEYNGTVVDQKSYDFFKINKGVNKTIKLVNELGEFEDIKLKWAREKTSPVMRMYWKSNFTSVLKKHFPNWKALEPNQETQSNYSLLFIKSTEEDKYEFKLREDYNSEEDRFKNWTRNSSIGSKKGLSERSINGYLTALSQISSYLAERNYIQFSLFEVRSVDYAKKCFKVFFSDKGNADKDIKGHGFWKAAANNFTKFLESDLSSPINKKLYSSTFDHDDLMNKASELMKNYLSNRPDGNGKPKRKSQNTNIYERDPKVVAWVLQNANGICQGCKKTAPFMRSKDGMPYLEVHHVKQLKDGGSDRIDNAVALCPNCHRKAHYGKEKSKFQKLLKLQAMKNII